MWSRYSARCRPPFSLILAATSLWDESRVPTLPEVGTFLADYGDSNAHALPCCSLCRVVRAPVGPGTRAGSAVRAPNGTPAGTCGPPRAPRSTLSSLLPASPGQEWHGKPCPRRAPLCWPSPCLVRALSATLMTPGRVLQPNTPAHTGGGPGPLSRRHSCPRLSVVRGRCLALEARRVPPRRECAWGSPPRRGKTGSAHIPRSCPRCSG